MEDLPIQTLSPYDKKSFPSIDVARFICAVFVILIHTRFFGELFPIGDSLLITILSHVAVPFFFVCNGFFIFRSLDFDHLTISSLKHPLFKLVRLYVVWTLLYFPYWLFLEIRGGISVQFIVRDLFLDFFWFGTYPIFWYLLATIMGILLIFAFAKAKIRPWIIFVIGTLLAAFYSFMFPYSFIFGNNEVVSSIQNVLDNYFGGELSVWFTGLFYMSIGLCIAYYKPTLKKAVVISLACVSLALFFGEGVTLLCVGHLSSFTHAFTMPIFVSSAFFALIYASQRLFFDTRPIRQISASMYFSHTAFNLLTWQFLKLVHLSEQPYVYIVRFLIVAVASLLFSLALYKLCKWRPFKWLV